MSRPGHIPRVAAIAMILAALFFFSLSTYAEDEKQSPREARSEDFRCRDCHGQDRFFPTYHKPAGKWKKRHGHKVNTMVKPSLRVQAKIGLEPGHVYNCALCHVDDACRKCHQLNRPKDHTGFWKMRGHGIRALAKRESCANCHNEAFCIRCHQNTKPINHRGNWNMVHGRVVAAGHWERCWVCHPQTISRVHVGAVPECRYCHPE